MILSNDPLERLFSLKWTIQNTKLMRQEEIKSLKKLSVENPTRENLKRLGSLSNEEYEYGDEVILNLRVTIYEDGEGWTYFLFPLKEIPIVGLLEKFDNKDDLLEYCNVIMMSIVTFVSRTVYYLTEEEKIKELLKEFVKLPTFEKRKEVILDFTERYLVKTLCDICEETDFYSEDFQDAELLYAHDSGLYDMYINSIESIQENIYFQSVIKNDIEELKNLLTNTFKSAKLYLQDMDISSYESIIGKKISNNEMKEIIEVIENNFFIKGLTQKEFGQFKTKRHPLSFLFTDRIVKSKYDNNHILESLTIGLVNSAISASIINAIDKKDRANFIDQIEILKLYDVDGEKLFLAEHLVRLCDSKKYVQYVPILAISTAYNALSEKNVLSLSKLLLNSVNPNTLKKHYTSLSYINEWEQIKFNN